MNAKINFKVMKKPELTDEEISSHMDFDKLLQTYRQSSATGKVAKWVTISTVATIAIVATTAYFYAQRDSVPLTSKTPPQQLLPTDTTSETATVNAPRHDPPKKINVEKTPLPRAITPSPKQAKKDTLPLGKPKVSPFNEAIPIDGYPSLYAYFDKALKYPTAANDSIQGIVTVSFAITKTGTVDAIKVENSLGAAFDAECIRVIQNMPAWKPATIDGKPVQTRLSIPLSFKIKK